MLSVVATLVLAGVFAVAGAAKLLDYADSRRMIVELGFGPRLGGCPAPRLRVDSF